MTARAAAAAACIVLAAFMHVPDAAAFGFEDVARRARELASKPWQKPASMPRDLQNLTYDQYREIRHRPEASWWRKVKSPFDLMFFHPGWHFQQPVRLHEVDARGVVTKVRFDPGLFDYGASGVDPRRMKGVGFAGLRLHYPVNTPRYKDEVIAFLGASYFRALGRGQRYGLSARGLAIDTALPSGEEFPRFTEFWVRRPAATAKRVEIFALLDSPRAAGAYRFLLTPGVETVVEVKARLFLRARVGKLGVAPLTSMYFFGENQRAPVEDYRPEVHDSDGLSIHAGNGEWIWRPLVNPRRLLVTSFAVTDPRGFGLMQRDRNFVHYEDTAARPELRPSAWVEPIGKWGPGRVELVQIPSPDDTNDNIVAYWVPDEQPAPGEPYEISYRIRWQKDTEVRPPHAWVVQTRRGTGFGGRRNDGSIAYVIDFEGPALRRLENGSQPEAHVATDANARLLERAFYRNEVTGGWRLHLVLRRNDDARPAELRVHLTEGNQTVSETWSYIIPPG